VTGTEPKEANMNATAIKLVINIWHDEMPCDPCEYGWKVHSFNRRHANFMHPDNFEYDNEEFEAKLKAGLAFPLSYYEHGQCLWSLGGELPAMAQCPWDSVGLAGFVVWDEKDDDIGAETVEDRRKYAAAFIARYTEWCNGNVFGYTVEAFSKCHACGKDEELTEEEANLDLPSCSGYYGSDVEGMVIDLKDQIEGWADYEVEFKEHHAYGMAEEVERLWKGE
jgi:hypothetical protein